MHRLSEFGGIPKVVRTLLRLSDPNRIEHYVCQLRPTDDLDCQAIINSAPALRNLYSLNLAGRWTRSIKSIPAAFRLIRLIRTTRPDVVHLHTGSSLIALPSKFAFGARTEWLFDLHEPLWARHSQVTARLVASMARQNASCVVHSPPVASSIQKELGIASGSITVIPLGVDLESFESPLLKRSEWRHEFGFAADVTLIVTVGKVSAHKGIWRLFDVAERIHRGALGEKIAFAVIGILDDEDRLRSEIRKRSLHDTVRLMGFVDDLPSALHAADIYFAPSSYEGFGLAVVEGMGCGLPVVATSVGGLTYVVEDGETGYLVDPENIEGFVQHLERLSQDLDLRHELGRRARLRAHEMFTEQAMVVAYEQLYDRIARTSV